MQLRVSLHPPSPKVRARRKAKELRTSQEKLSGNHPFIERNYFLELLIIKNLGLLATNADSAVQGKIIGILLIISASEFSGIL